MKSEQTIKLLEQVMLYHLPYPSIHPGMMHEEICKYISEDVILQMDEPNLIALVLLYCKVVQEVPDKELREKLMPRFLRVSILTNGVDLGQHIEKEVDVVQSSNVVRGNFGRK
jgi:hypothetical protein